MWPRIAELLLGLWLVLTPAIFTGTAAIGSFAWRDVGAGIAITWLSVLSFWRRTEWARLGTALLATALGLASYFGTDRPGPPAAQNEIAIALTLLLFAIVPNDATRPPTAWRSVPEAPHSSR